MASPGPSANPPALTTLPANKQVAEARKKVAAQLDERILDYKHNHPSHIETCITTLLKVFGNVLDNPGEAKYRQVKTSSNTYKTAILNIKGAEDMFLLTGWKSQVVELQKSWTFDGQPGSNKWAILAAARDVMQAAMGTIHEKAERKRREDEARRNKDKEVREKILLEIEDDKLDRKIRQELQRPLTGPVRAEPLPSEKRAAAPATPQRRQRGPEEEEEEEDEDEEGGPAAAPVFQGAAHKLGEPGDEHQQPAEGHTEGKKNQ